MAPRRNNPPTAVYACGEGLGHLTRARALLHTLGLETSQTPVLVRSGTPHQPGPRDGLRLVTLVDGDDPFSAEGRRALGGSLRLALERIGVERLVVDTFPAGLHGELTRSALPAGVAVDHVARLLRWPVYRALLPEEPVDFDQVWQVEPLHARHRAWLEQHSQSIDPLALRDPPIAGSSTGHDDAWSGRRCWLIVHSGPPSEIAHLVDLAGAEAASVDPGRTTIDLVLVAPSDAVPADLPPWVGHVDRYPATPLFDDAERVFTAAGFNAVRQLRSHRAKHLIVPFERRYDDQFARARQARAG